MSKYTIKQIRRSYRWLQVESLLSVMVFVVPIYTIFANSIGLSQAQIGISQAVFMTVALFLDVPSGWIADRFSRKFCNFFGDLVSCLGFVLYFYANSLVGVIGSEILIGIGVAFTNGADVALLKSYAVELKEDYSRLSAKLGSMRPLAEMVAFAGGGLIATYNLKATFLVTAGVFFIGAIISLFIKEVGVKRVTDNHPLRDMYEITKYSLHGHPELKWRIIASAVATNVTHTVIWLFTPMFLFVGFAKVSVGFIWAGTLLFVSFGSYISHKIGKSLSDNQKIFIPMVASIIVYLILGINISMFTIPLVLIFSLSRGWFSAVLSPMIQKIAPPDIQATVISVASLLRRVLYIPLVLIVNYLGNFSFHMAMIGSAIIYGLATLILVKGLSKSTNK